MAGEVARLAVSLDASGVSGGANGAAASLDAMKQKFQSASAEVKALEASMRAMQKGGAAIDIETFRNMKDQLAAAKGEMSTAAQGFHKLGGSMSDLIGKPEAAADGLNAVLRSSKAALGPLGGVFEKVELLKGAFAGGGGMYAAAALAAVGVLALVASLGILVYKMAEFALVSSDAAMKQQNMLEGVTGNAKAAGELGDAIGRVSSKVPLASAEVQKLGQKLYESGKRGAELERELMKSATAAAGLGKNPSAALLARSMLSLDVQTMKFHEHIAKIFSGVKIESFLKGIQEVLSVFDDTTASGKALKAMVEVMLNPLFDAISVIGPVVKNVFRGMVIGALLLAIAAVTVRNAIAAMIPEEVKAVMAALVAKIDMVWVAVGIGVAIVGGLVVALGALTIGLVVLAAAFAILFMAALPVMLPLLAIAAVFLLLAAVPIAVVVALGLLVAYFDEVKAALMSFASAGVEAAAGLISGLVSGIESGGAAVMAAIQNLASGAKGALMSALGIASPSKVFAELGVHTAAGFAEGVDAGSGEVSAAVGGMVDVPAAAPGKGGGGRGDTTINVTIVGVKGADEMNSSSFARNLAETIEALLDEGGAPVPA